MPSPKTMALLIELIDQLRKSDSWCGETHIQKATYLLTKLFEVPLDWEFVLYKHGPFSFDLRDDLTFLRASELVTLEAQAPYGPRFAPTVQSKALAARFPRTLKKFGPAIEFISSTAGGKNVSQLERLATALYVTKEPGDDASADDRAGKLNSLKPHIDLPLAEEAMAEVDTIIKAAHAL